MIADTAKKLSTLFDALNCETLSPASTARVLEICKGESSIASAPYELSLTSPSPTAIEARNKQAALELHLQLITGGANDVGPFQAAIKLIIQRMQ